MKNIVVVANQDRGKSFWVKEFLKKFHERKNYIFDINKEYGGFVNSYKGSMGDKEMFLNSVPKKDKSNVNVVFEEATAFFSRAGVGDSGINEHIFRRFHTGNLNIFIFHSLNFIPGDILFAIDFFVIFNTNDTLEKVSKKFDAYPKVIEAFKEVQEKTRNTFFNREFKTYPDQRSKEFFHFKKIVAK